MTAPNAITIVLESLHSAHLERDFLAISAAPSGTDSAESSGGDAGISTVTAEVALQADH